MSTTVSGTVTNGVVVLDSPLPEGTHVEIRLRDASPELPPELRDELAAWQQGSAEALALVERLPDEEEESGLLSAERSSTISVKEESCRE